MPSQAGEVFNAAFFTSRGASSFPGEAGAAPQPLHPGKPSLLWQGLLAAAAWSWFPWLGATPALLRREEIPC